MRAALLAASPIMNTVARECLFALLLTFSMPFTADARYPHGSILTGTVRSVDTGARSVVFVEDDGTIRRFVWTNYAKLWRGGIDDSPSTLQPGMKVRVTFHDPLFGADSVSQIVLLDPSTETGGKNGGKSSK